jgi:ornithine--oxo-acid transaminase
LIINILESSSESSSEEVPKKPKRVRRSIPKKENEPFPIPNLENSSFKLGWVSISTPLKLYDLNGGGMYGIYEEYIKNNIPSMSRELIFKEQKYGCNNYAPLPIVLNRGNGVFLKDVENNTFIDLLAAYSAVNHGHNNQNVIKDMFEQVNQLYMTSRAFYNDKLGEAEKLVSEVFGYEKVLFMNSGVEAGESAVKIARRWGYRVKGLEDNTAKIVFAKGNFWGRTTYACATSDDPSRYEGFGPLQTDSHYFVEYNNIQALEDLLKSDSNICALFFEPIQGENGVIIPDKGYLTKVSELAKKYNVLFIADEIQTGCGRAGHLLYCDEEGVKPDMVCLGKSLSSGLYPVSAVLTSREIMDLIKPGEHGSTYGGNPLAASIVLSAIRDILNKHLVENSYDKGLMLGSRLMELKDSKVVKEIRGRGLMFGLEFHEDIDISAYHFSVWLMERGVLTKPTKKNILRY